MNWRKLSGLLLGFLGLLTFTGCPPSEEHYQSEVPVTPQEAWGDTAGDEVTPSSEEPSGAVVDPVVDSEVLPEAINLDVPFFSQAPTGNWDMPYQEACEEASLLLAYYFVTGQSPTVGEFEADELAMVEWEIERFGQYEHTTIEETAIIAEEYLEHTSFEVVENPSVEDLKTILAQGHPIVAPMAGRALGNPYFTGEGPVYHMLVIRGYDDVEGVFITNDVGTRHGQNFVYDYDVFMNALHDWHDAAATDPEGIFLGEARVLVVKP